jgi:phage/plasmid-like protein (TIGR03299 family)
MATFHTAGALGNGERIWVLAKMSGQILIGRNDPIDKYLLLSNTHDGTGVVSIRFTPIRVVCQNTLNWAEEGGVQSVRHSKNISENLKQARADQLMRVIDKVFAEAETLFGHMAARTLRVDDVDSFLETLFPRTETQKRAATDPERWVPQIEEQDRWTRKLEPERWGRIKHILADPEVTPTATRRTLWGLYNAIVRDEDYRVSRQNNNNARLDRIWFGSGHEVKTRALNLAREQLRRAA